MAKPPKKSSPLKATAQKAVPRKRIKRSDPSPRARPQEALERDRQAVAESQRQMQVELDAFEAQRAALLHRADVDAITSAQKAQAEEQRQKQLEADIRYLTERAEVEKLGDESLTGPAPVYVTYAVIGTVNVSELVGATTTEPQGQQFLDVYELMGPLGAGALIGAVGSPMPIGSAFSRSIEVLQDSNLDIALAAFPSFVQRIS